MLFRSLLAALAGGLVLESAASPLLARDASRKREVPASHTLHERHQPHLYRRWSRGDRVPSSKMLPMRIGLRPSNIEAGHDKLMDISNPKSSNFGKHMTSEEVIDFFAPEQSSVDAVIEWLKGAGFEAHRIGQSVNKQWIQFDATTEEVENLLYTEYYFWDHDLGSHDISCEEYHVPSHVQEHIDYITPGIRLRHGVEKRSDGSLVKRGAAHNGIAKPLITKLPALPEINSTSCDTYVVADCVRVQYKLPNGTTAAPGNQLGIFESLDDHYSRADLDVFFSTLYPHIPNGTYPEERLVDGAVGAIEDPSSFFIPDGLESSLDFDSAWPLIYPQSTVLFQEDDEWYESTGEFVGFWNTFLDAIDGSYCTYSAFGETGDCTSDECFDPAYPDPNPGGYKGALQCGVYEPTNVISISYGSDEPDLPDFYLKRQCNEWMKLALQGTTVVMSAGDDGVESGIDTCAGDEMQIFVPDFAATCPYILAVGSTEWDRPAGEAPEPFQVLEEISTKRFPSGGGFSNVFGIPDYQRDAVSGYFDQMESSLGFSGYHHFVENGNFSSVTGGVYHHGGRAYPDVSAVGDRQVVYSNGSWWLVGGTSLSSPIWGATLTLVNEARIAAGKGPVGFIHQIIYQHPEAFNDVTIGSNPGCGTNGFPAAKGWDPVSGLGSPNYPVLLDILMSV